MQLVFIIIGCTLVMAVAIAYGSWLYDKRVAKGEIRKRSVDFMEKAEEFTLPPVPVDKIVEVFRNIEYDRYGMGLQGNSAHQDFRFHGDKWTARLYLLKTSGDRATYRLEFTDWKDNNGIPQDALNMNRLTTIIEKMFESFYPNVKTEFKPVKRAPKKKR